MANSILEEEPFVEIRHASISLHKRSDLSLLSKIHCGLIPNFLTNIRIVVFGTKLSILFPAILLAVFAKVYDFGGPWVFGLSLLGLTPLAERLSFLTEQIAYYTGPTVGGLLNATCGNVPELIIAIYALKQDKIDVVKYSLLGSILSNLLLVLGTSLFCCGIVNRSQPQTFDRKHADVNIQLLMLALLCHALPLLLKIGGDSTSSLELSRASSFVMLIAYVAYLVFQLYTHREFFKEPEDGDDVSEERAVIGIWSGLAWLVGIAAAIALLSQYAVGTIEEASESWGLSVSFISIILLPIVGNAAEHAGAVIFGLKNQLDISLGINLGSATQISIFVIPLSVVIAWIIGIDLDLDFNVIETGSLALSIIAAAFTLQDGTSHYLKGLTLILCYFVIGSCFFVSKMPPTK
ncbi:Vacuolar cation/proton exchanger 3 [Euphorbia peplus]|nr:Vacuolar cation/proton exchanger 3 [Euphorbia peplus]